MIKEGSRWSGGDGKVFLVLHEVVADNKVWVHYREENAKDGTPKEYSCYQESFLTRFTQLPDDHYPSKR